MLWPDVNALLAVEALPFPGSFHELCSRVAAGAALLQALVVAMTAAPSAAYVSHLLVLSKARCSLRHD